MHSHRYRLENQGNKLTHTFIQCGLPRGAFFGLRSRRKHKARVERGSASETLGPSTNDVLPAKWATVAGQVLCRPLRGLDLSLTALPRVRSQSLAPPWAVCLHLPSRCGFEFLHQGRIWKRADSNHLKTRLLKIKEAWFDYEIRENRISFAGIYGLRPLFRCTCLKIKRVETFRHRLRICTTTGSLDWVAWQVLFILLSIDPIRYRLMMLPSMLEKLVFVVPVIVLFGQHRVPSFILGAALIDLCLGVVFLVAYIKTRGLNGPT